MAGKPRNIQRKTCARCGFEGPVEEFEVNRRICKPCHKQKQKNWYENNKSQTLAEGKVKYHAQPARTKKIRRLQVRFKKSGDWFEKLWEVQDQKCPICLSDTARGKNSAWHLDHDHETDEVRGFLCHYCNLALGNFFDNQDSLIRAIGYLKSPPSRSVGPDIWATPESPCVRTKVCGKCLEDKDLMLFPLDKRGRLGRGVWCLDCSKVYRREYYLLNYDKAWQQRKSWYQMNKERKLQEAA